MNEPQKQTGTHHRGKSGFAIGVQADTTYKKPCPRRPSQRLRSCPDGIISHQSSFGALISTTSLASSWSASWRTFGDRLERNRAPSRCFVHFEEKHSLVSSQALYVAEALSAPFRQTTSDEVELRFRPSASYCKSRHGPNSGPYEKAARPSIRHTTIQFSWMNCRREHLSARMNGSYFNCDQKSGLPIGGLSECELPKRSSWVCVIGEGKGGDGKEND